jgi:subtilisin family serine protease
MGGGYQYVSGTSFSSPIVAGVAALMLSANSTLTAAEVDQLLTTTADDRGSVGKDEGFGWGRVNAYRAVAAAAVSTPPQDLTAPTVAITSPAAGAVVTGSLVVTVDATDAGGIGRVDLYVDGVLQGSDTTAPYSFTWNSDTGGSGARTLTVKAYDLAGNQSESGPVTVSAMAPIQDTTAPTVTIQSVTRQANKLRVAVSAVDDRSVSRIELYLDGALWATSTANPVVFNMNLKPLAAGTHGLSARAYDPSGNASSTSATMFSK